MQRSKEQKIIFERMHHEEKIIISLTFITCLFSICPIAQAEEILDLTQNHLSKETKAVGDVCIYGRGVYCFSHPGTYTGN